LIIAGLIMTSAIVMPPPSGAFDEITVPHRGGKTVATRRSLGIDHAESAPCI